MSAAPTIGYCFACDREGIPVYSVGAVVPAFSCFDCRRRHGRGVLRDKVNEIVAARTPKAKKFNTCRHCGERVLANPDGSVSLMCGACTEEFRRTFSAAT